MNIGIDLDDTLSYNVETLLPIYNRQYNDNKELKDITGWNLDKFVKPECGAKVYNIFREPGYFLSVPPREDAIKFIETLSSFKDHTIYVVTSYYPSACQEKADWLRFNFRRSIDQKNIIFCNTKTLLNLDILIDDGPHNLDGFTGYSVIFDKPWNRDLTYTPNYRMFDWNSESISYILDQAAALKSRA